VNARAIREGVGLITASLATASLGPYQLQAAIAAVRDEAPSAEDTDWTEILGLYELLEHRSPSPMVTLNHAVALAMVRGPHAGLDMLATLDIDERLVGHHRLSAVRAPTSKRWPVTSQRLASLTGWPPGARPASPNSATWSHEQPG